MKTKFLIIFLLVFPLSIKAQSQQNSQEDIRPYDENSRYWQYQGEPVLLFGGSDNDNLWQWTGSKLTDHLDLLQSLGGNYVRNTMSDRDEGDTYAFKQTRNGKYDLEEWNKPYWEKLEFFLEEASKRDIVVQLTLWDHFDLSGSFFKHPLNPENNITWNEGVISGYEDYYGGSVKENNQQVLDLQRKYVDKILSLTFKYGNILYNMSNESSLGEEWEEYWARYVKEKANEQNKEVFITSMHLVPSNGVRFVMSKRDLFDFVEISQNSQDSKGGRGRAHYENVVKWRRIIELAPEGPMPMNNEKIYGSADGRNYSAGHGKEAEDRLWKNIFGGAASARFHRPEGYWGIGLTERAQVNIKAMSMFLEEFEVFSAGPYDGIEFVGEAEAYALANIGKEYAVYFPAGRYSVELDVWVYAKQVSVRFLDIDSGEWLEEEIIDMDWDEELSDMFGYQRGISITTLDNRSCVAVIKVIK